MTDRLHRRSHEQYLNAFPHYTLPVKDPLDGRTFTIHFIALFSTAPNATPLVLYHGWPGSFIEFLSILLLLQKKYPDPATLPYHVVVPSLPGYAFSSKPPLDKDWSDHDSARVLNQLMIELGLGSRANGGVGGYIAQGGDIGSNIARIQAAQFDDCIAAHLNLIILPQKPAGVPDDAVDALEARQLARGQDFVMTGSAYAREHGTRPATIGLVLSASPIALLAWIGEKFLAWTDQDPSVDTILESVTLYWLTDTFPTAIYSYRAVRGRLLSMLLYANPRLPRSPRQSTSTSASPSGIPTFRRRSCPRRSPGRQPPVISSGTANIPQAGTLPLWKSRSCY